MSEWWTYRLSDLLMFSPATYWRLVERYNRDVWPLQWLTILAGALLLWWVAGRRPGATRVLAAVLAPMWLWVAWAFHWQHYASINWAAEYFAMAFAVQALVLLLLAFAIPNGGDAFAGPLVRVGGLALAGIGVFLYPLIAPATGRPWSQAEVLGIMPGPTAMVTFGLLIAARSRMRWIAVIPALAVLAELATRWVLQR